MELVSVKTQIVEIWVEQKWDVAQVFDLKGFHDKIEKVFVDSHLVHQGCLLCGSCPENWIEQGINFGLDIVQWCKLQTSFQNDRKERLLIDSFHLQSFENVWRRGEIFVIFSPNVVIAQLTEKVENVFKWMN